MDIWPRFGHADQGFILDKIKGLLINPGKFDIFRLGCAASGAGLNRARVLGFAILALPNEWNKSELFSGHFSSVGKCALDRS
jgi:hypothetical protein